MGLGKGVMMEPVIQSISDLEQSQPELASLLKTVATVTAQNVERTMGDLPGPKKAELAQVEAEDMLNQLFKPQTEEEKIKSRELLKNVYHLGEFAFGDQPGAIDMAEDTLIYLLPEAYNWVCGLLNGLGQFFSGNKGVS